MNLYQLLENELKKEPNFITDNGDLKKWVVLHSAQNYDPQLIELLLDDPALRSRFFLDIKGVQIFNHSLFIKYLEQKNYLNDSYTAYKNKVGLTINGKYIRQRNEVCLVWPFKDCILEGGQTNDESKRQEIFFNEVLAQDEINQLLEPKVLTAGKRYDSKGENSLTSFSRDKDGRITDNILVKGNNLLALHSIMPQFEGRVKLIYIDPPYNTGNDEFKYNDNFNESTWLTFMRNRLSASLRLLADDGALFMSIDENELGHLILLCNEIFGKENKANIISVKRGSVTGHKAINKGVINLTEYVVVYAKNKSLWKPNRVLIGRERNDRYNNFILNRDKDISEWKFTSLLEAFASHIGISKSKVKNHLKEDFEAKIFEFIIKNASAVVQFAYPDKDKVSKETRSLIEKSLTTADKIFHLSRENEPDIYLINGQRLLFYSDRLIEIDGELVTGEPLSDFWGDVLPNDLHNEGGVSFKKGKKPEKLLSRIIELGSNPGDLVLDYHLGSGTTAAVAMKMKRQFIGIEQLNYGENDSTVRLVNTIASDKSGISKETQWLGGGSFVYFELKKYNQSFIDQIGEANDTAKLLEIWELMKNHSFLNYNVDLKTQDEHIDDFKAMPLGNQKQHLVELLDKNQLYVNLSSLNDKDFKSTENEIQITNDFYQIS